MASTSQNTGQGLESAPSAQALGGGAASKSFTEKPLQKEASQKHPSTKGPLLAVPSPVKTRNSAAGRHGAVELNAEAFIEAIVPSVMGAFDWRYDRAAFQDLLRRAFTECDVDLSGELDEAEFELCALENTRVR